VVGMSDKKRTSITVDPDVYEYLSQSEVNQSGLINELVKEYKDGRDRQVAALELRYRHLNQEREEHQEKAERKANQAQEVKELLEDARQSEMEGLDEAREVLGDIPDDALTEDNAAVQNWAGKLGLDESTLLERL